MVNKRIMEYAEEFNYLGPVMSIKNRIERELNSGIAKGRKTFWNLKNIMMRNLLKNTKIKSLFIV